MNMLFVLIILSLFFLVAGVGIFFWAMREKQFKELEVQGYSILSKDEFEKNEPSNNIEKDA